MRIPAESLVSIEGTGDLVRFAVVLAALAGLAALVSKLAGLGYSTAQLTAAGRAAIQLTIVGSLISGVLGSWWLTVGFAVLMLVVASITGGRRVSGGPFWGWAFLPVCVGAVPVALVLLGTRIVPLVPISVVPILGILTGGAMTAMTLAGRRVRDALTRRHGEVEAALSIGLLDRDARLLIAREDAGLALVPGLDQTRTVGLVTLPGAFVGTLLGGATPLQAAAVQLVVLIALLAVTAISTVLTMELIARGQLPLDDAPTGR
ncbi:MAG TPA: ABC transporter permease [Dermatophilaceae bacterium]|jgi:putative ABC transport system permease protein|nr:ABC transporter permease [Dermatophilaceae bacterium]HMT88860.1 ABC transporter permease [Dermatophilaceae bacterium]